jgi:beta-lactamase class A
MAAPVHPVEGTAALGGRPKLREWLALALAPVVFVGSNLVTAWVVPDDTLSGPTGPTEPTEPTEPSAPAAPTEAAVTSRAPWADALARTTRGVMRGRDGDVSVYVHDLRRDHAWGWFADRPMYLASSVKLLFLTQLHRLREEGGLSFDETIVYRRADVRDGAPAMNRNDRGKAYPVSELITYMMRDSDNAASDMLLRHVGLDEINRGVQALGIEGISELVNLMDVRSEVYGWLDPRADQLDAVQVRDIRWRDAYNPRLDLLKRHIGEPYRSFDEDDLEAAYDDYYLLERNHASMRAMAELLARIERGELVSKAASASMRRELREVWSSENRARGAVPKNILVAHKTGTQRRRISDLAIIYLADGTPLVVTIAVSDLHHTEAELVMRKIIGRAFELVSAQSAT